MVQDRSRHEPAKTHKDKDLQPSAVVRALSLDASLRDAQKRCKRMPAAKYPDCAGKLTMVSTSYWTRRHDCQMTSVRANTQVDRNNTMNGAINGIMRSLNDHAVNHRNCTSRPLHLVGSRPCASEPPVSRLCPVVKQTRDIEANHVQSRRRKAPFASPAAHKFGLPGHSSWEICQMSPDSEEATPSCKQPHEGTPDTGEASD